MTESNESMDQIAAADETQTITADEPQLQGDQPAGAPARQPQLQLQVDDADTPVLYANTSRVWGSAEELNVDFCGPIRPTGKPGVARLKVNQRVVMNPWAAKRLAVALSQAVVRYEKTYGPLQLDERNRRINAEQDTK